MLRINRATFGSTPGNVLYDSFLNTWGAGTLENNLPLEEKSYFSALHVTSRWLRDKCLEVLTGDVDSKSMPKIAKGKTPADAKAMTDQLATIFDFELNKLTAIDQEMKQVSQREAEPRGYMHMLKRLMDIERNCFTIQINILKTGKVPPAVPPYV